MSTCNICGGQEFEPGPRERLSATGRPPRCRGCRSLERHRSLRALAVLIPAPMLAWRRALHLAPEVSIDPAWFRAYEASQYEGENSIDVREIDRPDGTYDFISLSMVLEFVDDDRRAFGELVRVGSESCILHCTFGSTFAEERSTHYEEPHGAFGRYHDYGLDLEEWFATGERGLWTVAALGTDPATDHAERFHFFCRRRNDAETLRAAFESDRTGSVVGFTPPEPYGTA